MSSEPQHRCDPHMPLMEVALPPHSGRQYAHAHTQMLERNTRLVRPYAAPLPASGNFALHAGVQVAENAVHLAHKNL